MNLLELRSVDIGIGPQILQKDITFSLPAGSGIILEGANGIGKTSLLRTLCGFIPPRAGQILWSGKNINDWSTKEHATFVSWMATDYVLPFDFTVSDIYEMGTFEQRGASNQRRALTARLGVDELDAKPMRELSSGQRKIVHIIRTLARDAQIYVLDEPFAHLDAGRVHIVLDLLKEKCAQNRACILSSHQRLEVAGFRQIQLSLP